MSNEKAPIPEDLHDQYWQAPANAQGYATQALIERIAALTAEVDALKKENFILDDVLTQQTERIAELKAEVARLSAPVSTCEWEFHHRKRSGIALVNALILARATPPQDVEKS